MVAYYCFVEKDQADSTVFGIVRAVPFKGYDAFYPAPLPDTVDLSPATVRLLTDTEAALGRLAGAGRLLPNPDLLIRPYLLREALASTRIEGTIATLTGVLEAEAGGDTSDPDIEEVVDYIRAAQLGIARLDELPFSVRLAREMHAVLLEGVRGRDRRPGEIRTTQNWIGRAGATIETATFVPPPPEEIATLLSDWERFANTNETMPVLIQSALLHFQFETIHPFVDGNGRLGRLLILFHLMLQGRLPSPLLHLSPYIERHRATYYRLLETTRRSGDPEPWFNFYLEGVKDQANDGVVRSQRLADLRDRYLVRVLETTRGNAIRLVDVLFAHPIITARVVEAHVGVRRPTALRLLDHFVNIGIIEELHQGPRGQRRFVARDIVAVLDEDTP